MVTNHRTSSQQARRQGVAVGFAVRVFGVVIVGIVIGWGGGVARAEDSASRELEAKTACLAGRLDKGIEILARLFAETNDPTYIYNQGRCFEQNGRASEAVTRFREYLRKAQALTAEETAQVQAHIREMEDQIRQAPVPATASATPPSSVPSSSAPEGASPSGAVAGSSPASGVAPGGHDGGHAMRAAGIVVASVGAAAVVVGVIFGLRAASLSKEVMNDANGAMPSYSSSKYDDGRRAATLQWVGYGVGAAALATGGLLYYFGARRPEGDRSGASVAVLPLVTPTGASGSLWVTF